MNETLQNSMNSLIKEYPMYKSKIENNKYTLKYSNRLKNYNGYVKKTYDNVVITLSGSWQEIDDDIKAGIIHILLAKIFKLKIKSTQSIDLYNSFIKSIPIATKKDNIDTHLKERFNFINNNFFLGLMEMPNLKQKKLRNNRFGYYNYLNDTICINSELINHPDLLDYVLYHEMLHKQLKFDSKGTKTFYHTKEFKEMERKYPNSDKYEHMLKNFNRINKKPKEQKSFISKLLGI